MQDADCLRPYAKPVINFNSHARIISSSGPGIILSLTSYANLSANFFSTGRNDQAQRQALTAVDRKSLLSGCRHKASSAGLINLDTSGLYAIFVALRGLF